MRIRKPKLRWYDFVFALVMAELIKNNIMIILYSWVIWERMFGAIGTWVLYDFWLGYCMFRFKKEYYDK